MQIVNFELGTIDPRNTCFDHHGAIPAKAGFVAKMASVQLIEWYAMTGCPEFKLQMDHAGHLDDLCAHALLYLSENKLWRLSIGTADEKFEKEQHLSSVRVLYKFALQASGRDSAGPGMSILLDESTNMLIDWTYNLYQSLVEKKRKDKNIPRNLVPLTDLITSSKEAGEELMDLLLEESSGKFSESLLRKKADWMKMKYSLSTWVTKKTETDVMISPANHSDIAVVLMASDTDPYTEAERLYSQYRILIFYKDLETGGKKYWIFCKSPYLGDLSALWKELSVLENCPETDCWGGHPGAGGSPRKSGSHLIPQQIVSTILTLGC